MSSAQALCGKATATVVVVLAIVVLLVVEVVAVALVVLGASVVLVVAGTDDDELAVVGAAAVVEEVVVLLVATAVGVDEAADPELPPQADSAIAAANTPIATRVPRLIMTSLSLQERWLCTPQSRTLTGHQTP